jgi:hypothetical protein
MVSKALARRAGIAMSIREFASKALPPNNLSASLNMAAALQVGTNLPQSKYSRGSLFLQC